MAHEHKYPDMCLDCVQQLIACVKDGFKGGDLLGHLKQHRKVCLKSSYVVLGYVLKTTVGEPGDIEPIGFIDPELESEFRKLVQLLEGELVVPVTGKIIDIIRIVIWIISLLSA